MPPPADDDVAAKAKESGKTRAITAMQESLDDISGGIVVVGCYRRIVIIVMVLMTIKHRLQIRNGHQQLAIR